MMIFQTFKVSETWVVLVINELDYPSFENFESLRMVFSSNYLQIAACNMSLTKIIRG